MPGQESSVFSILLVCTGNICRSALAERLGRAYLDSTLGPLAGRVQLSSAGTRAVVGADMHPDTALVLRGFGGDPEGHMARQLDERMAWSADLTLTMTHEHRRSVLALAPRALARTFTLREAADVVAMLPADAPLPARDLPGRARAVVAELAAARSRRGNDREDDVPDPIGRPLEVQEDVGEMITAALLPILARLVAPAPD